MAVAHTKEKEQTLVPYSFLGLDIPTQRWYALSLGVLLQALKISDVVLPRLNLVVYGATPTPLSYFFLKWNLIDASYIFCLPRLRLPKLVFAWQASLFQFLIVFSFNFLLFGPWTMQSFFHLPGVRDWYQDLETTIQGRTVRVQQMINSGGHLQGQHTVILSPINTVQLNPFGDSFCLDQITRAVTIPILFNNTIPNVLQYRQTSIDSSKSKIVDIATHHLVSSFSSEPEDFDEENEQPSASVLALGKTESLKGLKVTRTGIVSLEFAGDARIRAGDVRVVECPRAEFIQNLGQDAIRCDGESQPLSIKIRGTPPLTLEYHTEVRGQWERHLLEGIASELSGSLQLYEETMDLSVRFTNLGSHVYALDRVIDSLRNTVNLNNSVQLTVIRRSSYSFRDCGPGQSLPLLISQGATSDMRIISHNAEARDGPWTLSIASDTDAKHSVTVSPQQQAATLQVSSPGTYQITAVQGQFCEGIVLNPAACTVVEQPLPQANITWSRIHECSGDTGITASLMLQGKPPFRVAYSTKHDSHRPHVTEKTFTGSRGEIVLQPDNSGHYKYSFVKISDANYKDVPILGAEEVEQTVRPLASAQFARPRGREGLQVSSCEGSTVDIDVDLKGIPPWAIEVQIVGPSGSSTLSLQNLTRSRQRVTLPIPKEVDRSGGTFQIDLVSVHDAQGCRRALVVPGLSVNVRRVKPTAKFYTGHEGRKVTVLEGESIGLPMRLGGEGPWTIKYSHSRDPSKVKSIKVASPNDFMKVSNPGVYTIHEVHDSGCPGKVIADESTYEVALVPRPRATLSLSNTLKALRDDGGYIQRAACEGVRDHVDLEFEGRSPFQIQYKVSLLSDTGPIKEVETARLSSIHKTTRLDLETSRPGRVFYDIEQISDALYPLHAISHDNRRLQFQQDVLERPRAYFKSDKPMIYCMYESLLPKDDSSDTGVVVLRGELWKERVLLKDNEWKISVPDFSFKTVGSYVVSLDSLKDESNCEETRASAESRSITVNVAETAAVVPYEARQIYCVGEQLRFQLEGMPPWQINYVFNNQNHTASTEDPLFHRLADVAGDFSITSVAHQSDKCRTQISDVKYSIRAIPSARVSHGRRFSENIREGEQAEIIFDLLGEPPFTFTYQRTEVQSGKKGAPSVLETKTISGVRTHQYSVFSSQEGTWTVTFIADKYCKYPSLSAEGAQDKL